jgi:hypothetical protein
MYRLIVLYDEVPDPDTYAEHIEVCRQVPNAVFRHGKIFGSPMGEPPHAYYAEFEFADEDAFKTATRSDELIATGKDAQERGLPHHVVEFVELG